jgi:hypothetical protein
VMYRNGRVKLKADGTPQMHEVPYKHGRLSPSFVSKHKLTSQSHPSEILDVFVPFHTNTYNKTTRGEFLSIEDWTKYTNTKAILANAGQPGTIYPKFKPFTMSEIRQHLGLYILNGLNPSPSVEMKFKSALEDPVHGSDLCYNAFGPNARLRHKELKCFFGVQPGSKN